MPQHASGSVSDINSHNVEIELIQILNNNGASAVYEKRRAMRANARQRIVECEEREVRKNTVV